MRGIMQSPVVDADQQNLILGNVLDGLDDLFDRRPRAALNLWRLLVASGAALGGDWERNMSSAASQLLELIRSRMGDEMINGPALSATDDLRTSIAAAA